MMLSQRDLTDSLLSSPEIHVSGLVHLFTGSRILLGQHLLILVNEVIVRKW